MMTLPTNGCIGVPEVDFPQIHVIVTRQVPECHRYDSVTRKVDFLDNIPCQSEHNYRYVISSFDSFRLSNAGSIDFEFNSLSTPLGDVRAYIDTSHKKHSDKKHDNINYNFF